METYKVKFTTLYPDVTIVAEDYYSTEQTYVFYETVSIKRRTIFEVNKDYVLYVQKANVPERG